MTPPTVTIAGKEYPWPCGCEYFENIDGMLTFEGEINYIRMWDEDRLKYWLPIIAAVAVMHFENIQYHTGLEINALDKDKHFGPFAISSHARMLVDKQALAGQSATAWRELCREM